MIVETDDDLQKLKVIGKIVANVLKQTASAIEPGITPLELDKIARALLEKDGARSAPESVYNFPGATCISVNEAIAHGIPDDRPIRPGDLVNIDVSAEKDGIFADNGASFPVPPVRSDIDRLCKDGRKALNVGLEQVGAGKPFAGIGNAIGRFAKKRGYTLIENLAGHGIGHTLHDEPTAIPSWPNKASRKMKEGVVFAIEPFLSLGGEWAHEVEGDKWTLHAAPLAPTVQYEHTVVATRSGPLILTIAD
ncbi:MAG: type I methionyl aminopeptidase [Rhodobacteraceae bacterium]|nr:type I methionyl aminopeptidase [Paracoccaceae bacterium]